MALEHMSTIFVTGAGEMVPDRKEHGRFYGLLLVF